MTGTAEAKENELATLAIWDCGSPLYDSYELASLSHLIERHLMAIPSLSGSKKINSNVYYLYDLQNLGSENGNHHIKGNSSSVLNTLCEFIGTTLWKRRIGVGQRKEKNKRFKIGFSCFCCRFGFEKKQKYIH